MLAYVLINLAKAFILHNELVYNHLKHCFYVSSLFCIAKLSVPVGTIKRHFQQEKKFLKKFSRRPVSIFRNIVQWKKK